MKITLGRRDRGIGIPGCIIIIVLLCVLIGGIAVLIIRAIQHIPCQNCGGGSELTNDNANIVSQQVLIYTTNAIYAESTNPVPVAFRIDRSTNLLDWEFKTNWVSADGSFDWQMPSNKNLPCEFFKITIYGTNQ